MWMIIFKDGSTDIKYDVYDIADIMDSKENEIISIVNLNQIDNLVAEVEGLKQENEKLNTIIHNCTNPFCSCTKHIEAFYELDKLKQENEGLLHENKLWFDEIERLRRENEELKNQP